MNMYLKLFLSEGRFKAGLRSKRIVPPLPGRRHWNFDAGIKRQVAENNAEIKQEIHETYDQCNGHE
jgi:hypothetical protein